MLFPQLDFARSESFDPLCGPKSLHTICEYFGVSTTFKELCTLSGYNQQSGTTLFGLYQAALKKALPAVPLKINIDQLCSFKSPSIAFIKGNHFIVVHGCIGDKITLQNPPNTTFTVLKEVFEKTWNGEALVFSEKLKKQMNPQIEKGTAPPKGPHIHFNRTDNNFGTVNEGEKLSYTFTFTNTGTETLTITARSTCSCTATLLSDKSIPPGVSGEVLIEYDTKGKKGPTKQGAHVRTNDPDNPLIKLTISANIRSTVKTVPDRLWLDEVALDKEITREILVIDAGDSTLKIESIKTPEGITAKILPAKMDNLNAIPVLLTINSGSKPGKFEKQITIHTYNSVRPEIPVSIFGKVLSEVRAFPPAIFFGEVKPNTKVIQEVTLSSTNGERLEITKAISLSPYISTEVKLIENSSKYKLLVVLHTPQTGTTLRDKIPIYIKYKTEPVIEVPLYARVVEME